MRSRLEMEADAARSAIKGALEDAAELDERWPASKRGSNAQRAFNRLRERLKGALTCLDDGLTTPGNGL